MCLYYSRFSLFSYDKSIFWWTFSINIRFFFIWILEIISVVIMIPFLTLLERKILRYIQLRKGPKKVRFLGILQPVTDGLKLVFKGNWNFFSGKIFNFLNKSSCKIFFNVNFIYYFYSIFSKIFFKFRNCILFMFFFNFNLYNFIFRLRKKFKVFFFRKTSRRSSNYFIWDWIININFFSLLYFKFF